MTSNHRAIVYMNESNVSSVQCVIFYEEKLFTTDNNPFYPVTLAVVIHVRPGRLRGEQQPMLLLPNCRVAHVYI